LILKPQRVFKIEAYVDASFATHMDGKSHTGVFIKIGGVGVFFALRKHKCVSKSPTEAELIALSEFCAVVSRIPVIHLKLFSRGTYGVSG
jgi:hypothetical protein